MYHFESFERVDSLSFGQTAIYLFPLAFAIKKARKKVKKKEREKTRLSFSRSTAALLVQFLRWKVIWPLYPISL